MTLAAQRFHTQKTGPWRVWLHGLLGDNRDWNSVIAYCSHRPSLVIDLPGHGGSQSICCHSFDEMNHLLIDTLSAHGINEYDIIGYSLGGRLALYHTYYAQEGKIPRCVITEGSHMGLSTEQERSARWENDKAWAVRFRDQPIKQVLQDWYQQPVFCDLTPELREQFIIQRRHNCGSAVSAMLESTSLAKQPNFLQKMRSNTQNMLLLCGEYDTRFRELTQKCQLPVTMIPDAGHNAHRVNPNRYASIITRFLSQFDERN